MTQKTISPFEYKTAQRSIESIKPVLSSLENINAEALQGSIDAIAELQAFKRTLIKINEAHQGVIDQGLRQYAGRPIELINRAAARLNGDIPRSINLEKKNLQARIDARSQKVDELYRQGFVTEEVDKLIPHIGGDEVAISHARVAELEREREQLLAFLADSPRFSTELLNNTQLAQSEVA